MTSGLVVKDLVLPGGATTRSFSVEPGSILALVGPSGGERARLLLAIASLLTPVSGTITLDGRPVEDGDAGIVDEDHSLVGGLSAVENVAIRILGRRGLGDSDWSGVTGLLAGLGMPGSSWHNLVEELSGGQQQRVAVARALVDLPPVLCLDEPTSELDPSSAELVWTAIDEAAARGAVVVIGSTEISAPAHADVLLTTGP